MAYHIRFATLTTLAVLAAAGAGFAAAHMSEGSKKLEMINHQMHAAMSIEMTGDVDADFVRGMIPHHQGAIDMAKVLLEHGQDPELRKLAEAIVSAQDGEIAFMRAWLEKKGIAER